jgi:rhodanese-related sulfurtransferase
MSRLLGVGVIVAASLLFVIVRASEPVPAVDIQAVEQALKGTSPPMIVDVRTPEEFQAGHIPKALNIPLSSLEKRLDELSSSRDSTIYLVCEVGGRSAKATQVLLDAGFSSPVNVSGGTRAWRIAKLPLEP